MAARCVSKAEFAKLAGVSKPAISKALRGKLAAALVDDRVDIDHPASVEYLRTRGKTVPARAPTKPPKKGSKPPPAPTRSAKKGAPEPPEPTEPRRSRPLPPPRLDAHRGLEQLAELNTQELLGSLSETEKQRQAELREILPTAASITTPHDPAP